MSQPADPTATVHPLPNGLTVIVEPLAGVRSAAMSLAVPCGTANDPADAVGCASVLSDVAMRGAGDRSSRELSDALDRLGIQRDTSTGLYHSRFSAAATAGNLLAALPMFADVVRRPHLTADDFEACRQLALQDLDGLDDDPRSQVLLELRKRHWPEPLGRNTMGELEHLEALTVGRCRAERERRYVPSGSILAIAGDVEPARVVDLVAESFGTWAGEPETKPTIFDGVLAASESTIDKETEQTHIGIACPYVRESDPEYYIARVAAEVLSGGSSGRLFTEIREVKGLCYSVGTSYAALRDRASLIGYAGTSNDRAQATLDAFVHELKKLSQGVDFGEVDRHKVGLMSATVMSGESTAARAGAIAGDYFSRGRVRPLAEIVAALDAVTAKQVDDFVRRRPLGPFTIVTVGASLAVSL